MPTSNITYMDGEQIISGIGSTMQAVSGMTIAEAEAALGATASPEGGAQIISFPMVQEEGGQTISLQAAYASELWDYFKTAGVVGGITTALGAAAAGARSWASGVLIGDASAAGSLAGTGALLSMSLPAVAAAAAPILGVSIGNLLYESNPELWTKISQTLLPFAYADTEVIPAVVDENGQAYLPKGIIDALKQLFDEEGIGPGDIGEATSDLETNYVQPVLYLPAGTEISYLTSRFGDWYKCKFSADAIIYPYSSSGTNNNVTVVAKPNSVTNFTRYYKEWRTTWGQAEPTSWTEEVRSPGVTTTYWYATFGGRLGVEPGADDPISRYFNVPKSGTRNEPPNANTILTVLYGDAHSGYFPAGTSQWTGDQVDIDSTPTIDVVSGTNSTIPYFPIQLPIGDPTVSPDPAVQPNPIAPSEIPFITPFVSPQVSPASIPEALPSVEPSKLIAPQSKNDPIYIPYPDLNPELDPSDDVPAPDLTDVSSPPQSGGQTPPIIFPSPGVQWPSVVPSSGSGLVHVYNPTPSQFISFGNWLWVTYADTSIQKLWNNPFDGVIGAHELYATPSQDGTDTIRSGFLDSGINSTVVRERYTSINCGSIVIPEYYGNYLDYTPYTKAYIYLPFIGVVEVDADDIVGHSVNILYHVDSYSGSCIAQITVARDNYTNTVYQFSGNCAVDIPLAGGSQSAIRAALISAAAYGIGSTTQGIISGAARGGLGGAAVNGVTNAIGSVASGIANAVCQKSTVQHSGSFGASYGAMGIKKPYIIIRRPVQKQVTNYNNDYGFPAHKRVTIGSCTGFLRVREVNVTSTLATNEEKAQIENWLKAGVYVS